ncbi:hypothetical protein M3Y99_01571400 [Aphelenchoides fujianensis]|nr:hypothetical protein M3Y99_01571400 [Aphelenchoides fujianensis]
MAGPDVAPQAEPQAAQPAAPQAPAADLGQEGYANIALTLAVQCRYRPPRPQSDQQAAANGQAADANPDDEEDNAPPKNNNADNEQKLLEFAACNDMAAIGFRRLFPSSGTTMAFEETAVTFKWTDDELAFMTINNAIKFLRLVEPKINRVLFNNTRFLRVDIIRLADVLNEMDERVLDNNALLQFRRTSNDNAYATLIEKLGLRFSRVSVDDEFVPHLQVLERPDPYDYMRITICNKVEMTYIKAYFDLNVTELDIHRVANVPNTMEFDPELFRMRPTEIIRKLHMGLSGTETDEKTSQFAERLRWLTPNLEKLTLVHGVGFKFLTWNEVDSVRDEVLQFVNTTAPRLAGHFSGPFADQLPVNFLLELSIYADGAARNSKHDWAAFLQKHFDRNNVHTETTEIDTKALVFTFDGPRVGATITARLHVIEEPYKESAASDFLHGTPLEKA